jgi:hypothetical protein
LRKLSPQMQQVVLIRSQVWKQDDIADVMEISRQRVATLPVDAALKVAGLNEERHDRERPVASPRAARLRELEEAPPVWLTNAIGTLEVLEWGGAGVAARRTGDRPLPARVLPSLADVASERDRRSGLDAGQRQGRQLAQRRTSGAEARGGLSYADHPRERREGARSGSGDRSHAGVRLVDAAAYCYCCVSSTASERRDGSRP